jgi:hypothetical protein
VLELDFRGVKFLSHRKFSIHIGKCFFFFLNNFFLKLQPVFILQDYKWMHLLTAKVEHQLINIKNISTTLN